MTPPLECPKRPPAALIERTAVNFPTGPAWTLSLYRTRSRPSGRRILIHDEAGKLAHDTDDCYDFGNAHANAEGFLAGELEQRQKAAPTPAELVRQHSPEFQTANDA